MNIRDFWSKPASEQSAIAEQTVPKVVNPCIRIVGAEYVACDGCGRDIPKGDAVKFGDETRCENCIPEEVEE